MIVIEKGTPVPEPRKRGAKFEPRYPWKQMEPGDSFIVPNEGKHKDNPEALRKAFQSRCFGVSKAYGFKFRVDFDGSGVLRCWRVE